VKLEIKRPPQIHPLSRKCEVLGNIWTPADQIHPRPRSTFRPGNTHFLVGDIFWGAGARGHASLGSRYPGQVKSRPPWKYEQRPRLLWNNLTGGRVTTAAPRCNRITGKRLIRLHRGAAVVIPAADLEIPSSIPGR